MRYAKSGLGKSPVHPYLYKNRNKAEILALHSDGRMLKSLRSSINCFNCADGTARAAEARFPLLQKKAKKRKQVKISSILLTALTVALPAYADLFSSTGTVSVIAPPASVVVNSGLESNTLTYFFTEHRDLVLPSAVAVNITAPGLYNGNSLTPGTIAVGTKVDSYYLHTDPVGTPSTAFNYVGSVTFDTQILGVIVLDAQFNASNGLLGAPGTLYSATNQGLELGSVAGDDSVLLSTNGKTLSYNLETSAAADDIRIITAASVPEPSGWILLFTCAGLCVALRRQRRSNSL